MLFHRYKNVQQHCLYNVYIMFYNVLYNALNNQEGNSEWLTLHITYLIPKTDDTIMPKNYVPIACLFTTYKTSNSTPQKLCYCENHSSNT